MASFRLVLVLLLFESFIVSAADGVYRSCRDHYLQGAHRDGAFEIQHDSAAESFLVNCEFPTKDSGAGAATAVVHGALAKWHLIKENRTIGYQIRDRQLLAHLIEDSDSCEQTLHIHWQGLPNESNFTVESVSGVQRSFPKSVNQQQQAVNLVGAEAGILHLFLEHEEFTNQSAYVRASPLRCTQNTLRNQSCLFTFNKEDMDGLSVNFYPNLTSMEFSFRCDRPTMPFVRVHLANRQYVNIDLIDGYLLTVNHIIHPMKLLADGRWHRFRLAVPEMAVYIDDAKTAVKITSEPEARIDHVDIALSGEVTDLLLNGDALICANTNRTDAAEITYQLTPNLILDICPSYEENYCNCKAPNSAIAGDHYATAKCDKGFATEGYHLMRASRALSFFYTNDYHTYATVSVLFKSYSDTGLLIFGASEADPSIDGVVRTQVYFKNNAMHAVICHPKTDGSEKCRSCSVTEARGFRTPNWNRVSLFNYKDYHYMTVNENICQLTPEEGFSRVHEIYKLNKPLKEKSALFVGGTFYAKNPGPWQSATREFKDYFWEHTREKPQSLDGCIGEIRVNGRRLDLDEVFEKQLYAILEQPKVEAFSMRKGCIDCETSHIDCHGTVCLPSVSSSEKSKQPAPTCACEDLYSITDPTTGSCRPPLTESGDRLLSPSILLSYSNPEPLIVYNLPINRRAEMYRFWMVLTFPTSNQELQNIVDFKSLAISVGDYGRLVIVELDSYIREEFVVDPSDDRAHLLSIKRLATIGTSERAVTVQLDNDVRQIQNDVFFEYLGDKIVVNPVRAAETGKPGCIMDIGVAYEFNENTVGHRDSHQQAHQLDWKEFVLYSIQNGESASAKSLISLNECGIRDPSLWSSGTDSFGVVGEHDPKGFFLPSPLGSKDSLLWIFLAAGSTLAAILLCFCCFFCLCTRKPNKTHEKLSTKNGFLENGYNSDRSTFLETPEPSSPDFLLKDSSRIEAPKSPSGTSKAPLVRPEDV